MGKPGGRSAVPVAALGRAAKVVLSSRGARIGGAAAGILFLFLYLISIGHLFLGPSTFFWTVVDQPWVRLQMTRAPFLWEPVAGLSLWRIRLFLSPLNLFLGMVLSFLVFLNIAVAVYSYRCRKSCSLQSGASLAGLLPAMLTGFACCAPTFLIALFPVISSISVFVMALQPFLIPVSLLLMTFGFLWSLGRLQV